MSEAVTYIKRGKCHVCGLDARRRVTFDLVDGSLPEAARMWLDYGSVVHARCSGKDA